jgi:hypothetical protein
MQTLYLWREESVHAELSVFGTEMEMMFKNGENSDPHISDGKYFNVNTVEFLYNN